MSKKRKPRILIEIVNEECTHAGYLSFYNHDEYGDCIACDKCGQVAYVFAYPTKEIIQYDVKKVDNWEEVFNDNFPSLGVISLDIKIGDNNDE